MTSVPDYVTLLNSGLNTVALELGSDLSSASMETRVAITGQLALLGTVIKVLVDKGVFADSELVDTFNTAVAEAWPTLPNG